jgi:hypothetical protein
MKKEREVRREEERARSKRGRRESESKRGRRSK